MNLKEQPERFSAPPAPSITLGEIEALVHLALAYSEGRGSPAKAFVEQSFESLGDGHCGMMEDPPDDEFVTLASTPAGNFRIFEGIWQGASFHLERILDVVERMPDQEPFNSLRPNSTFRIAITICGAHWP
jgi:hypothetical protein